MKRHFPLKNKAEVIRLLDQHCDGDGEISVYHEGWSDRRIADELQVHIKNVSNVRYALKGKFVKKPMATTGDLFTDLSQAMQHLQQQAAEMMDLRARLVRLEREVAELRARA
jgi:hypothetical protein